MSVVLLLLGIAVTAAGLAAAGFGIMFNELPLTATLVSAGTTAGCAGLILIGLSAMVRELHRLAEALKGRPAVRPNLPVDLDAQVPAIPAPATASVRPPAPAVPRPEAQSAREPAQTVREPEQPPAAASVDVSAAAIERLRSTIPRADRPKAEPSTVAEGEDVPLSPNGGQPAPARAASAEPPLEPRLTPADRPVAAAVETIKPSRLDFLFRARQARPLKAENLDTTWPGDSRPARSAPARSAEPRDERPPSAPAAQAAAEADARHAEPPIAAEPQPPAILKSGVVDGMAYTLYADGSIEAKLPTGTVRFGSIAELRAHIESNA
jgi:hypothetical protein